MLREVGGLMTEALTARTSAAPKALPEVQIDFRFFPDLDLPRRPAPVLSLLSVDMPLSSLLRRRRPRASSLSGDRGGG